MRYRVIKTFADAAGNLHRAGETMSLHATVAASFIACGFVMQDKSLDGASETKIGNNTRGGK